MVALNLVVGCIRGLIFKKRKPRILYGCPESLRFLLKSILKSVVLIAPKGTTVPEGLE